MRRASSFTATFRTFCATRAGAIWRCRLRLDELKVSFLSYPDFLDHPHPALRHAITVDLVTGKSRQTDYTDNINPPILHRKETFLPSDHPRRAEFAALTKAEEAEGLYEHTATIGFKLNWERLLNQGPYVGRPSTRPASKRCLGTKQARRCFHGAAP